MCILGKMSITNFVATIMQIKSTFYGMKQSV